MKIFVEDGLIWYVQNNKKESCEVLLADKIAQANGSLYAEQFIKLNDNDSFVIDDKTLKIMPVTPELDRTRLSLIDQ